MSRDNFARLIQRNPIPTNLRERAVALRLTAARLTPPRDSGTSPRLVSDNTKKPTDWTNPPAGFIAYPSAAPKAFLAIELAIPAEARRLYEVAKAEFDRVATTLADDPKTILATRRELHLDALHGIVHSDPLSLAATPAWTGSEGFDPAFAAIARHRETWAALNEAAGENDEIARAHLGLDTSPETMAETEKRRDAADLADFVAWDAVVAVRPSTLAGARAWLDHIESNRARYEAFSADNDLFGAVCGVAETLMGRAPVAPLFQTPSDAPTDWADPPEGFMAYPALVPAGFLALEYALPQEAQRLYRIAQRELDRVTAPNPYGRALPPEEVNRRRHALRVDELRAAAYGQPIEQPRIEGEPSRIAGLFARLAVMRNEVNGPSARTWTNDEINEACDRLRALEYDLFAHPSRDATDLAIKLRAATEHLEPRGLIADGYTDAPEVRAWQGLAADIERLARGADIAGTVTVFDGRPDPMARPAPIFGSVTSGADPVLIAIEAARTATRKANEKPSGEAPSVGSPEETAAADETRRLCDLEDQAYQTVFQLRPTTREGLFALIDFARERSAYHADMKVNEGDQRAAGGVSPYAPEVLSAIRDSAAMLLDGVPEAVGPDPILDAIKWERVAWQAANAPDLGDDERQHLSEARDGPFEAILAAKPTTLPGLLALIRTLAEVEERSIGDTRLDNALDLVGDHLSRLMGTRTDPDPGMMLVDAIEREWVTYAHEEAADQNDDSAEAEARRDARLRRRGLLLDAAERLPASSRSARHAKALAETWVEWVCQEAPGQSRENYLPVERYAFDVHHSLLDASEGPSTGAELVELGREWEVLLARKISAQQAERAANDLFVDVPMPPVLWQRQGDIWAGLPMTGSEPIPGEQGKHRLCAYQAGHIEELRSKPRTKVVVGRGRGPHAVPDQEAQARADAIVAAWDEWQAEIARRRQALNLDTLWLAADAAEEAFYEASQRIRSMPAKSLAGLVVKAIATREMVDTPDMDEAATEKLAGEAGGYGIALAADVLRLMGESTVRPVSTASNSEA